MTRGAAPPPSAAQFCAAPATVLPETIVPATKSGSKSPIAVLLKMPPPAAPALLLAIVLWSIRVRPKVVLSASTAPPIVGVLLPERVLFTISSGPSLARRCRRRRGRLSSR